ncbi:MAG: flagellar basal body rod protein FlgB [Pseudolabrys sp.]
MPITDIPIFSMLRTKMQWHQERQRLLAENIANSDTPGFKPRDLAPLKFDKTEISAPAMGLTRTSGTHIGAVGQTSLQFHADGKRNNQIRPGGNAVSLEDEIMKVAGNQMDYQAATALYTRGLGLIKTALGRK